MPCTVNLPVHTPLLAVKNLTLGRTDQPLLQQVSFELLPKRVMGVIGASGSGKSSLAMALLGLLDNLSVQADDVRALGRRIKIERQNTQCDFADVRGKVIGYVFQEPKSSMNPVHSVRTAFEQIFDEINLPKSLRADTIKKLLTKVHLPNPDTFLDRYPHQLSGGEACRIAIAQVLALSPAIIITDEITAALDEYHQNEIMNLLIELSRNENLGVMMISHDLHLCHRCDDLLVFEQGRAMFGASQTMLAKLPKWDFGKPPPQPKSTDHQPILQAKSLCIGYKTTWPKPSNPPVLTDFNLTILPAQIIGIAGRSGIGKSTLAKAITHTDLRLIVKGELLFSGQDWLKISGKKLQQQRAKIQLVPQDTKASFNPLLSIKQSLDEAILTDFAQSQDDVNELLQLCQLSPEILQRYPHELSGGESQRLCLIRALLAKPKLLILDEPTAMLDEMATVSILQLLRTLHQKYATAMMIISHDQKMLRAICHQVLDLSPYAKNTDLSIS